MEASTAFRSTSRMQRTSAQVDRQVQARLRNASKPDYLEPRFKFRLTVVGCLQQYRVDFEETFAPIPRLESIRATLSEMALLGLEMIAFDIATAFLNATVDKPIYMTQPEGFIEPGKEDHVCLLLKAVYGIKQDPHPPVEQNLPECHHSVRIKTSCSRYVRLCPIHRRAKGHLYSLCR